ncbi:MAG: bifunctional serine/threonine-protein kinase/formylglycine-generating enzyme family protein [Planctomycetota bacterium]
MSTRSKIDDLLFRWEEMHLRGDDTSLEVLCRDNPELLESLRQKVRALEAMDPVLKNSTYLQLSNRFQGGPLKEWERSDGLRPGSEPVEGYVLESALGRGGFGEVWKAIGHGGFHVAIKFVNLEGGLADTELRSLDAMKNLRHPHLISSFGAWRKGNSLILAMELADRSLMDRLTEAIDSGEVGIPKKELLAYMEEAARGLDFLNAPRHTIGDKHEMSLQHRDIKPQNLLLVGGSVKLGDFGLLRALESSSTGHTGSMTLAYAPPEFVKGKTSIHSDQYSLAITYCHLRGGRVPFTGNYAQIMNGHLRGAPDLSMLPANERPTVARALAKDPSNRWPSCQAFVRRVSNPQAPLTVLEAATLRAGKLETKQHATPFAFEQDHSHVVATSDNPPDGKNRLGFWWVIAVVSLLVPIVAGILLIGPNSANRPPSGKDAKSQEKETRVTPLVAVPKPRDSGIPKLQVPKLEAPAAVAPEVAKVTPLIKKSVPPTETDDQKTERIISNSIGMVLVWIPPGRFMMGSPPSEKKRDNNEDEHEVDITKGFWMGKFEVTQEEYTKLMGGNPSKFNGPRLPVETVSWNDAREFCRRLSEKEGKEYTLPTEAEWEYACRAGTKGPFSTGKNLTSGQANYNGNYPYPGNAKGVNRATTVPVGSFAANGFGLHDMHGNVWEWCEDWYGDNIASLLQNPKGPAEGSERVLRGGGFADEARGCRSAIRGRIRPSNPSFGAGFRIVMR